MANINAADRQSYEACRGARKIAGVTHAADLPLGQIVLTVHSGEPVPRNDGVVSLGELRPLEPKSGMPIAEIVAHQQREIERLTKLVHDIELERWREKLDAKIDKLFEQARIDGLNRLRSIEEAVTEAGKRARRKARKEAPIGKKPPSIEAHDESFLSRIARRFFST